MRKIILLIIFLTSISSICAAEDIYMGDDNGTSVYLRTDSIKSEMYVVSGVARTEVIVSYKTIGIHKKEKLQELQKLCFDESIDHSEYSYSVNYFIDRITGKAIGFAPSIFLDKSTLNNSNNAVLYKNKNTPRLICTITSKDPNQIVYLETYDKVIDYLQDHPEAVHVTYK